MEQSEPLDQPDSESAALVRRIFRRAVERVGSVSALATELRVPDPELRLYVAGEAVPPTDILLRLVELLIDLPGLQAGASEHDSRGLSLPRTGNSD
jgi:hypothetical protein